jgi:hypothetical protein
MRLLVAVIGLLVVASMGCEKLKEEQHTVRGVTVSATKTVVYLRTSSAEVARAVCSHVGGDLSSAEIRGFAAGDAMGRVQGCYVRAIALIICADGDAACVAHEEKHRREGQFHIQ